MEIKGNQNTSGLNLDSVNWQVQNTQMTWALNANIQSHDGNTFTYKLTKGTRPNLMKLKNGQRVCASGVKGFHILMTPKK